MGREMIKGAQKSMIVVKTSDSSVFEEAYFVIRKGAPQQNADMVREANRIIDNSVSKSKKGGFGALGAIVCSLCFAFGGALGGAITALICLLL